MRILQVLLVLLLVSANPAVAQYTRSKNELEPINFAYSAVVGTGIYRVGVRDVYLLRAPASWQLRDQTSLADGTTKGALTLLLPVTFGFTNFSPDFQNPFPDEAQIDTFTFLPGLQWTLRRTTGWTVKPYGQLGAGRDTVSNTWTGIYAAGISGSYPVQERGENQAGITYGHRLVVSGAYPEGAKNTSLGYVSLGADFVLPQTWRILDTPSSIGLSIWGDFYFREAEFLKLIDSPDKISRVYTMGVSLVGSPNYEIMGIPFQRAGIGFKFGPNVRALTVFASFPF